MVSTISVIFEPDRYGSIRLSFQYLTLSHRDRNSEVALLAAQSKWRWTALSQWTELNVFYLRWRGGYR